MNSAESIHELMATILGELPAIGKVQRNEQQGFMFRGHDDVLNALNPLLAKHRVFAVPEVRERITAQRQTSKGSVMFEVNLHVAYRFYGPAGDYVEASAWGEGTDMGDKATNKAMTMAFKNVLNQVFAISTAETVDSDAHTPDESVNAAQPVQARQNTGTTAAPTDPHGLRASRADAVQPGQEVFGFGKHKGSKISEVPRNYLEWWLTSDSAKADKNQALRAAVELHLGLAPVISAGASDGLEDIPF